MRHRRVWRLVLSGAVAAFAVTLAAIAGLTRTEWGRERVLRYTLETLGGRLQPGAVLLADRLEGSLITGARLHNLEVRGADGELVMAADSAYLNYELPSFFGGDVVLNGLVLYNADVNLHKLPGDSLWNYQELLLDTTRTPAEGPPRATLIELGRLVNGRVVVRAPWDPGRRLPAAERARLIREALGDSSRLEVARAPGGLVRTMRFQVSDARVSNLVIAADERGGTYVRVDSAAAVAHLYRGEPLHLRHGRGELGFREGVLRYEAPVIVLPGSRLRSEGVVDLRGEEPSYDLTVETGGVATRDLEWLYPHVPQRGSAAFKLWLETRPEGTLYRVRDLRFDARGTRLVGSFGLLVDRSLQFTDVDLRADPLRVQTIEEMLPTGLPVRGLHIGSVEIRSRRESRARATGTRG